MANEKVLELTDKTFDENVLEKEGLVLVDFWAPWCNPCQIMGPIIDELAEKYDAKMTVAKINIDENQASASKYGVMSIPNLIFFKNGEQVEQKIGTSSADDISEIIDALL